MKAFITILILPLFMALPLTSTDKQMSGEQLDALMTGNTIYLTNPDIVLWYGADGSARAKLSEIRYLTGTWSIKGDLSCILWSYAPNTDSCSKLVRRGDTLVLLENGTDRHLGTVRSIVPGNAEGL